jgi:hypothetical protein
MTIDDMFGDSLFEKATEGIAKRVVIFGAIAATKELIRTYDDIDKGFEMLLDGDLDDMTKGIVSEVMKDMNSADKELIALASMLEARMGISA